MGLVDIIKKHREDTQSVFSVLNQGKNAVHDKAVEPAISSGGDYLQDKLLDPLMNRFNVPEGAQELVHGTVDGAQDAALGASDFVQEVGDAAVDPFSEVASKYQWQIANLALQGDTPLPGPQKLDFVADSTGRFVDALDQGYTETAGGDPADATARETPLEQAASWTSDLAEQSQQGLNLVDDALHTAYPDMGTGGDKTAQGGELLDKVITAGHDGIDTQTQQFMHNAGNAVTGMGALGEWGLDFAQGGLNMGINGLQAIGLGPSEKTQSWFNKGVDSGQESAKESFGFMSDVLHNSAAPMGDAVADQTLRFGGSALNGFANIGQLVLNGAHDVGQAIGITGNSVAQNHDMGISDEQIAANTAHLDAQQGSANTWFDTQQHKLTNTIDAVADSTAPKPAAPLGPSLVLPTTNSWADKLAASAGGLGGGTPTATAAAPKKAAAVAAAPKKAAAVAAAPKQAAAVAAAPKQAAAVAAAPKKAAAVAAAPKQAAAVAAAPKQAAAVAAAPKKAAALAPKKAAAVAAAPKKVAAVAAAPKKKNKGGGLLSKAAGLFRR